MKQKKRKASVKGMTLVECLVALCVFSVCAGVLVQIGTSLNQVVKSSITTQEKLCIQSPRAQARMTDAATVTPNALGLTSADPLGVMTITFQSSENMGGVVVAGPRLNVSVGTDTFSAGNTTLDPTEMQTGAQLNYMVFDLSKVAGAGLAP